MEERLGQERICSTKGKNKGSSTGGRAGEMKG